MKNIKKIMLVSSSTGGHALPIFELSKKIVERGNNVIIIHTDSTVEREVFVGFKQFVLKSGKISCTNFFDKIIQMGKLFFSLILSLLIILKEKPNIIISKGGFNSVPILFWAKFLRITFFIHESDIVMGRANKIFANNAKKVFVAFPIDYYPNKGKNFVYSGMIVREFGHDKKNYGEQKNILITGGSQGAKKIIETLNSILPELLKKYRVINNTGTSDFGVDRGVLDKLPKELRERYSEFSFSYGRLSEELMKSDLIISRAGANVIGEISKLHKASILIPYPYASGDHQNKNAKYLEKYGATILIKESKLTSELLLNRIEFIFSDERNQRIIGENIGNKIKTDGLEVIIEEINSFLGEE